MCSGGFVELLGDEQAELIVNLRQHYERWTGRAFRMRAACQKYDVPQCNRRRDIIDGGRNHYHFLAGDDLPGRAPVEYEATYRGVAETRRGARRMGVPVETGLVVKYADEESPFLSEHQARTEPVHCSTGRCVE